MSPGGKRPGTESYDQKLEQRAAKHEFLRDRNNATTCRCRGLKPEAEWKNEMQRKRQVEFQRRRNMGHTQTQTQTQTACPVGDDREPLRDPKVPLRTTRQRGVLVKRQSLISAEELGITWPDIHSPGTATWIMPSTPHQADEHTVTVQQDPISEPSAPVPQEAPLWNTLETRDTVHPDRGGPQNSHDRPRDACCQTESGCVTVKEKDLVQLAEYLKEALWREETLKHKLALLQHTTSTLLLFHNDVWKSCCQKVQMEGKIASLESQLKICVQRLSKEGVKRLLLWAEQQRQEAGEAAMASIHRLTSQKTQAQKRADSLEMALQAAHAETDMWRKRYEGMKKGTDYRKSHEHNIDQPDISQHQTNQTRGGSTQIHVYESV